MYVKRNYCVMETKELDDKDHQFMREYTRIHFLSRTVELWQFDMKLVIRPLMRGYHTGPKFISTTIISIFHGFVCRTVLVLS